MTADMSGLDRGVEAFKALRSGDHAAFAVRVARMDADELAQLADVGRHMMIYATAKREHRLRNPQTVWPEKQG